MIKKELLELCRSEEYAEECLIYEAGTRHREEKLSKRLEKQCPFATNNRCDHPWEWTCKGSTYPFPLTTYEVNEKGLPKKDAEGNIVFTRDVDDFKDTCLVGGPDVYTKCPHYVDGMRAREEYYEHKPTLKSKDTK